MKKWIVRTLFGFSGLVALCLFVTGCSNNSSNDSKSQEQVVAEKGIFQRPCCSVDCGVNGKCKSWSAPCHCDCKNGFPSCGTTVVAVQQMADELFDGRVHVLLNSNRVLSNAQALVNHLHSLHKSYADSTAAAWEMLPDVVGEYGYGLTTREGLMAYYQIIEKVAQYEESFTEEEMEGINQLITNWNSVPDPDWDNTSAFMDIEDEVEE